MKESRDGGASSKANLIFDDLAQMVYQASNGFVTISPGMHINEVFGQDLDLVDFISTICAIQVLHMIDIPEESLGIWDQTFAELCAKAASSPSVTDRYYGFKHFKNALDCMKKIVLEAVAQESAREGLVAT